ncbi:MAG: hypothetical protein ACUVRD_06460 [Bacteroidia bacterium]
MHHLLMGLWVGVLLSQPQDTYILIKLKKNPQINLQNCLNPALWEKKTKLRLPDFTWEATFQDDENQPRENCTYPQFLLIAQNQTYVISLFCQEVFLLANTAPFKPSYKQIEPDITFNADFRYFIEGLVSRAFRIQPQKLYEEYAIYYVPPTHQKIDYQAIDLVLNKTQIDIEPETDDEDEPELPPESPIDEIGGINEEEIEDD